MLHGLMVGRSSCVDVPNPRNSVNATCLVFWIKWQRGYVQLLLGLQDVLEVVTLGELLPQLAYHLQACLHKQQW